MSHRRFPQMFGLLGCSLLWTTHAFAKIHLDLEPDPLPLVKIDVIIPSGADARKPEEAGLASLLGDILDGQTARLDRQAFQDELATFGASFDFSLTNQYSFWSLSFPLIDGQNYEGLASLMAELWNSPRFTGEAFDLAKSKLENQLKSMLDSDGALASSTQRRWITKNLFGGFPIFIESVGGLKLDPLKDLYARDFQGAHEIIAFVVAPEKSTTLVEKILTTTFKKQGDIARGRYLEQLPSLNVAKVKSSAFRKLLIVDKPGRNQSVTTIAAVSPRKLDRSRELAFLFGNHLLVESGLGSLFGDEIRNKRGLAYSVAPQMRYYLGQPTFGFSMNPVRVRSEEAFKVASELVKSAYETGEAFKEVSEDTWKRQWQSFRFGRILDGSTPDGRVHERMAVATGTLGRDLYLSDPATWNISRKELESFFTSQWKQSAVTISVVGLAGELKPMLERSFKAYDISVIPYQDTIHAAAYGK